MLEEGDRAIKNDFLACQNRIGWPSYPHIGWARRKGGESHGSDIIYNKILSNIFGLKDKVSDVSPMFQNLASTQDNLTIY